ncbi:THUMP domain-containing class I SAM-dependent RNA methyltransferase [Pseudooceanicola nitratireducens]|uniref:THUMP domain-containing class I SAM-dependent RNA methyltransferase n=1 Tax=Pseudooceanicola nitratireducens TaxID=517719 RepID=UPI001C94124A|nr:class I SAM-dependent RNA methyltransferase [Pseudooceanicola nitratireducens]MBY6155818.1 class I SAM-dependent RNA methyltransferase [Pseudooceanicola nitratireducens]
MSVDPFEIFLVCAPGLEPMLAEEARSLGFPVSGILPGGVTFNGLWPDVWRANLALRGATRVLARIGDFRAFHLAQLDKRARKFDWGAVLRPDVPVSVEATCIKSKIYHDRAAAQRIETALREEAGITIAKDAPLKVMARIEDNLVTVSVDTSGDLLHKRGHKAAVGKAPMRETLAALFLRRCGYTGGETVVDPMCGSGTFVIEAAEMALGFLPGRSRRFAFEQLSTFDPDAVAALREQAPTQTSLRFYGSDRDAGAVKNATANADRAGVSDVVQITQAPISDLARPEGAPGLVIINPPYGGRIGNRKMLFSLYGTVGEVLTERFRGWRVGIITDDGGLAKATGLPFLPMERAIDHGGLKVKLYRTDPLP